MHKELSPIHDLVACEICERTILKGERTEAYLAPDGARHLVCDLCVRRAESAGWIRESAHADMPTAAPRSEARPSLLERFRRWRAQDGAPAGDREGDADVAYDEPALAERELAVMPDQGEAGVDEPPPTDEQLEYGSDPPEQWEEDYAASDPAPPARVRESGLGPRDPRHVRAVPTNSQVKVERALELFNASDYRRTVAGLVRTLGQPWVTALPAEKQSEVIVVVAWELSWYQYRIDLGDIGESVVLVDKGHEIDELAEELRDWNGSAAPDGSLAAGAVSER